MFVQLGSNDIVRASRTTASACSDVASGRGNNMPHNKVAFEFEGSRHSIDLTYAKDKI